MSFNYYKWKNKITDTVPSVGTQAVLNDIKAHLRTPDEIQTIIVEMRSGVQHIYEAPQ